MKPFIYYIWISYPQGHTEKGRNLLFFKAPLLVYCVNYMCKDRAIPLSNITVWPNGTFLEYMMDFFIWTWCFSEDVSGVLAIWCNWSLRTCKWTSWCFFLCDFLALLHLLFIERGAGFESALRTNAECVTHMLLDCYDFMGFYLVLIHRTLCTHDKVT